MFPQRLTFNRIIITNTKFRNFKMPTNKAAYISSPHAKLTVKEAPYPANPGANQLIVKTAYVAINPLEYKVQDNNPPIAGKPLQYPTILGADLSGTIIQKGDDVKNLKIGDEVIANCIGAATGKPEKSAFQEYVLLDEGSVMLLPENVGLKEGVVLPLAMDTAAAGLFALGFSTTKLAGKDDDEEKGVLLVWGGSSSVGCCAIQLARAAGYEVLTTASKRNHPLCEKIGATKVFDYADKNVEDQITSALKDKNPVGAIDCISSAETIASCTRIFSKINNNDKKVITVLNPPSEEGEGVEVQRLSIPALRQSPVYEIVHAWMPKALAEGTLRPAPEAMVIGEGLEFVQEGLERVRKGVSATKVVVKIS